MSNGSEKDSSKDHYQQANPPTSGVYPNFANPNYGYYNPYGQYYAYNVNPNYLAYPPYANQQTFQGTSLPNPNQQNTLNLQGYNSQWWKQPSTPSVQSRPHPASSQSQPISLTIKSNNLTSNIPNIFDQKGENVAESQSSFANKKGDLPLSLKNYVRRCFANCPENKRIEMEDVIRDFLKRAVEDGRAFNTDWSSVSLIKLSNDETSKSRAAPYFSLTNSSQASSTKPKSDYELMIASKNLGNSQKKTENIGPDPLKLAEIAQDINKKIERMHKMSSSISKKETFTNQNKDRTSKVPVSSINNDVLLSKKLERMQKFEVAASKTEPTYKSFSKLTLTSLSSSPSTNIMGTCTSLEKAYLRLTTEPDASQVRPLSVLKKSFDHVMKQWETNNNYSYISEQLKSIRQDLTIQGIRNDFAVKVYEENGRLALMNNDITEFNQCQTVLKQLYAKNFEGHQIEFFVYNILYLIYTNNHIEMNVLLSSLKPELFDDIDIKIAIKLYSYANNLNFVKFFKIYHHLSLPCAKSLLQLFLDQFRIQSLKYIVIAFQPKFSAEFVSESLGFQTIAEFWVWLKSKNIDLDENSSQIDSNILRSQIM